MLRKRFFVFVATLIAPSLAVGQMPGTVPADPRVPVKEGFDTDRAIFWAESNFVPFQDPEWRPLSDVREAGEVEDVTPVLVFEAGGSTLVLVSSQMTYHHVAQGEMKGEPWMVTF